MEMNLRVRVEYRSPVGTAMYLAQERYDLQFATKTLASCLQNPTKAAWALLGRLVGCLRFSGEFGLKMNKTKRGSMFSQTNLGVSEGKERNQLEICSDSDWRGGGDMKSTSSAVHILNGLIVHSTSHSQECTSLSSTEAEWYASSAGVCDAYYCNTLLSSSQMAVVRH